MWAPIGDLLQVSFRFSNRGSKPVWVNRRCAVGHLSSGADILLQVFDVEGQRVPTRRRFFGPPSADDYFLLEPTKSVLGEVYELTEDYDLARGRFRAELTLLERETVPQELVMESVWIEERLALGSYDFYIRNWGEPPPVDTLGRPLGSRAAYERRLHDSADG